MKVALYHRNIDQCDRPSLEALIAALHARGIEVSPLTDGDSAAGADYLFSVGGDGTLLSCVQFVGSASGAALPPVLGINFGHLGFLTTVGRDGLDGLADQLIDGRFSLEERTLLAVSGPWNPSAPQPCYALNEAFLHRPEESSMLRTEVYVDDRYVATYAGDGVIVATPTGSTAYSLSCGGPILTPDSGSFVITPIGAHTLTLRPIIVPDSAHLRLVTVPAVHHAVTAVVDEPLTLGLDSRRLTLRGAATVDICRAPFTVRLVRLGEQNFFSAMRDKLMWGTEIRP